MVEYLCPRFDKAYVKWWETCRFCIYHKGEYKNDAQMDCDFPRVHWSNGDREEPGIADDRDIVEDKGNAWDNHDMEY